jgi:hypothetical protein
MSLHKHFAPAPRIARLIGSKLWVTLCFLVLAASARADVLAYDFIPDHSQDRNDGPWSLGWEFTVNTPIWVTALDFWDNPFSALTQSHDVAIYDSTQTEVAFATVLTTDPLAPGAATNWREHAITPVYLAVGDYVIAGETGGEWFTQAPLSTFIAPEISYVEDRYQFPPNASLVYPADTSNLTGAYFGPSFEFTDAATPEPSTFGLILGGLASAAAALLRRRLVAKESNSRA